MEEIENISFTGTLGDGILKMFKGALRAFNATRRNDIYITHVEVMSDLKSIITSTDTNHTQNWYHRLGHVNAK